jgi:hypothetical protein
MRLQFEIPEDRVKDIDDLVKRTGIKTRVQLFNNALSLFEWAIREREVGNIIASVNEKNGKYKEIEMPGFPNTDGATSDGPYDEQQARFEETKLEPNDILLTIFKQAFEQLPDLARKNLVDNLEAIAKEEMGNSKYHAG